MTNPAPEYRLTHEPDESAYTVRENLVDILEREMLGPINGPEELLPTSPRQLYLVGHIAPFKLAEGKADPAASEDGYGLVGIRADEASVHAQRGIPAESAEQGADGDEDDAEDTSPRQGLMIPASMGLRFQVPDDLAAFTVSATWGTYHSVATEEVDKQGRPVRAYQRSPVGVTETIKLAELREGRTRTIPLSKTVCLRVDVYTDSRFKRRLIEIALCNDVVTPARIPVEQWLFQTKLHVSADNASVFLPVRDVLEQEWDEPDEEMRRLDLQYRDRLEFAVGRTCSVDWSVEPGSRRANAVWTTWLPTAEIPQTRAQSVEDALLDMRHLAEASIDELRAGLVPLVNGYGDWLDTQQQKVLTLPVHLRDVADEAVQEARSVHKRLADGLAHVLADGEALRCFRFMNEVMREQRVRSQVAALRIAEPELDLGEALRRVETDPDAAVWRPFQLAFILIQLPALTDPTHGVRSGDRARVELLFFPTGGGKTEAYLGLAAYTFAVRRRQGIVNSAEGPLDGSDGVAVLMRYTLRLLTAQQFQRATTLVCAAELARRRDEATWGAEPFRIGLWVGTDVSPKRWEEAKEQLDRVAQYGGHRLTVLQVQRCPWCGSPIGAANVRADVTGRRVFVHCGDDLARCPFARGGSVPDGLPILTVDEEIYRMPPAFLIATVDKFARLAREGEAASLFGYVARRCGRHGYVHPDFDGCDIATRHDARGGWPVATVQAVSRLRPPDLIIQDELHLITGALGTAVGLFEVAVETLSSWRKADGQTVRPLIVASTATVRKADEQVRGLYGRRVEIFPPQVLDIADTYFSEELTVSAKTPGRRYVGVSAQGVRLSSAEIRVAEVMLVGGQLLLDRSGRSADPYMTLVAYFNAIRELAGMARYVADDVQNRVRSPRRGSGLPRRVGSYGQLQTAELTSRISSGDIGKRLNDLAVEFDPDFSSTEANLRRAQAAKAGEKVPPPVSVPFDVVLATSMLQVGVDVQRLGLMLVVGQPKNTAEYIQASSRVGRDAKRPGLVVALGNWARPRDLAHFEQFRHYHETFYARVEALSVTPFSPTSMDRGIDAVLVATARVQQAHLDGGLSPERNAWRVRDQQPAMRILMARLQERILAAAQLDDVARQAQLRLANRLDQWSARTEYASRRGQTLVYERTGQGNDLLPLMISPENARAQVDLADRAPFTVAHSMREVQPEINMLVSPIPERLYLVPSADAPQWTLPVDEDES